MEAIDLPAGLRQSVISLVYKQCTDMFFKPDFVYACILRILSYKVVSF